MVPGIFDPKPMGPDSSRMAVLRELGQHSEEEIEEMREESDCRRAFAVGSRFFLFFFWGGSDFFGMFVYFYLLLSCFCLVGFIGLIWV